MNRVDKHNYKKSYYMGYAIVSFMVIFMLSFFVLFYIESEIRLTKIEELKNNERRVVDFQNDFLGSEFSLILSDLHYLHHAFKNQLLDSKHYSVIAENWKEFSTHRRIYDQIRFIDRKGDEKIRININENGSYIVPTSALQNKKERYYFYETVKLKEEDVYVSQMDLNIEQGKIEEPYKPMIRVSTPIYDDNGSLLGIIVLNYLAEYMLERFRELAQNSQGELILLNSKGYWLSSDNPNNDWNFMFEERKNNNFQRNFISEWESIQKGRNQIITNNGIFTFSPVLLQDKYNSKRIGLNNQIIFGDGSWYVVSILERNKENSIYFNDNFRMLLWHVFKENAFYFILICFVSSIVGFLVYVNSRSYSKIKYYSEYDSLTKVYNRRAGLAKLNEQFLKDDQRLISLCFIDINGLKEVNDTLGHKLGDELIISVADIIQSQIRGSDFLVRLGGDEFLIVFNGMDSEMAENIWQRIVNAYDEINKKEKRPYLISVSHGIEEYNNKQKNHVDALIHAADEKMYIEKQRIKENLQVIRKLK